MGEGIIRVSRSVFVDNLIEPQTLEEWHKTLMLPGHYAVLASKLEHDVFHVTVESKEIYALPDNTVLPEVIPHYVSSHAYKGEHKVHLDRIEVSYREALRARSGT